MIGVIFVAKLMPNLNAGEVAGSNIVARSVKNYPGLTIKSGVWVFEQ